MLEACVANKVQRLVYSSSASVYGDAVDVPMTEAHPFKNRNFYGATKIAGEGQPPSSLPRPIWLDGAIDLSPQMRSWKHALHDRYLG